MLSSSIGSAGLDDMRVGVEDTVSRTGHGCLLQGRVTDATRAQWVDDKVGAAAGLVRSVALRECCADGGAAVKATEFRRAA